MASLTTASQDSLLNIQDEYVQAATANNTRRSYRSGIKHFIEQGGELPATAAMIVQYLKIIHLISCYDKIAW